MQIFDKLSTLRTKRKREITGMFKPARSRLGTAVFACAAALGPGAFASTPVAVSRHCITSGRPAEDSINGWERESYPIGNGWFGVNVFGRVESERLQVTEN